MILDDQSIQWRFKGQVGKVFEYEKKPKYM